MLSWGGCAPPDPPKMGLRPRMNWGRNPLAVRHGGRAPLGEKSRKNGPAIFQNGRIGLPTKLFFCEFYEKLVPFVSRRLHQSSFILSRTNLIFQILDFQCSRFVHRICFMFQSVAVSAPILLDRDFTCKEQPHLVLNKC